MNTQQFFIPHILPGMNDIIKAAKIRRGKWSAYADQKRDCEQTIVCSLNDLRRVRGLVWFDFIWFEKSKRRDLDNIAAAKKFILDALVSAGIIENDGWKNVAGWTDIFKISKENPGVKVVFGEVE